MNTRREFLLTAPLSVLGASVLATPALAASADTEYVLRVTAGGAFSLADERQG